MDPIYEIEKKNCGLVGDINDFFQFWFFFHMDGFFFDKGHKDLFKKKMGTNFTFFCSGNAELQLDPFGSVQGGANIGIPTSGFTLKTNAVIGLGALTLSFMFLLIGLLYVVYILDVVNSKGHLRDALGFATNRRMEETETIYQSIDFYKNLNTTLNWN